MNFRCEDCDKVFTGIAPYKDHLMSSKHLLKTKTKAQTVSDTQKPFELDKYIKKIGNEYKCIVCNLMLNSLPQVQLHVQGKKHRSSTGNKIPSTCSASVAPRIEFNAVEKSTSDGQKGWDMDHSFNFHNIVIKNPMIDVKIIGVDDPITF